MEQEIVVYIVVGLAVVVALWTGIRRLRAFRRGKACAGCAGCPLRDKCSKQP